MLLLSDLFVAMLLNLWTIVVYQRIANRSKGAIRNALVRSKAAAVFTPAAVFSDGLLRNFPRPFLANFTEALIL